MIDIATGLSIEPPMACEDRKLYVIPPEATVVKEMFRRRAQRQTYSDIARWLNDEYPRTGKYKWSSQTVKSIITSRIYVGAAFSGKQVNPDAHEPIVTLAQFETANSVVPDARKRNKTNGERPLLAGIIPLRWLPVWRDKGD
jgi:Recombinase